MGFGFNDWLGQFYPKGLKPNKYLSYYSRIFNSVEIDSTFYGTPGIEKVLRWKNITSEKFKISVKVPREITHIAKLVGIEYEMKSFIESVRRLDEKLGVVLIQFPAAFVSSNIKVLTNFIKSLPDGVRYALEIRDSSWFDIGLSQEPGLPKLAELLRESNICWVSTMYPGVPQRIYPTTDFLYIRWIGRHGKYPRFDRVRDKRVENLNEWISQIVENLEGCSEIYGYFNNDYSGFSPETTNQFKSMIGLESVDFSQR